MAVLPLAGALVLALIYMLGNAGSGGGAAHRRRWWSSAAAGASVAYVFVDILPELGAGRRAVVGSAGESLLFAEQRIYVVALLGFVVFYGLEHMVLASRAERRRRSGRRGNPVYWLHAAGFAAYSWLVGYLLVPRAREGWLALLLYTVAMAFHFLIVDRSLHAEHGLVYDHTGRWLLAASVLVGWLVGSTTRVSEPVLARLFAFLAGGVVITSVQGELTADRERRFWLFCFGSAAYAALLLAA
jgi:hypothetical protein